LPKLQVEVRWLELHAFGSLKFYLKSIKEVRGLGDPKPNTLIVGMKPIPGEINLEKNLVNDKKFAGNT